MPLSYKIVLGSVALLCLLVIGFKAVSSGDDQPQPIAATQSNVIVADTKPTIPDTDTTRTSASDANTSTSGTQADIDVAATGTSSNVTPDASTETEPDSTTTTGANLADVTKQLAAETQPTDGSATGSEAGTDTAPARDVSASVSQTTQAADTRDASKDGEDKGLDDLLARIRQYEADVLGDEAKTETGTSTAADVAATEPASTDTAKKSVTAASPQSDIEVAIVDTNAQSDATDVTRTNADTTDEIIIPDNPPVLTIGRGAPIHELASDTSNTTDTSNELEATKAGDAGKIDGSEAIDSSSDVAAIKSDSTSTLSEDAIAAAVFDPPVVVASVKVADDASSKRNNSASNVNASPPVLTEKPIVAANHVAAAESTAQKGTYTIKPGDTFSSIAVTVFGAERHWLAIANANPKVDSRRMRVGQIIKLPDLSATHVAAKSNEVDTQPSGIASASSNVTPAKGTHTVRAGETLWSIAKEHYGKGELWHHIYKSNRNVIGSKPGNVRAGMTLQIAALPTDR